MSIFGNLNHREYSPEIKTLTDYRNRYALYKSDPLLKRAHANLPWGVVWDDHEVDNNYAGPIPEEHAPRLPIPSWWAKSEQTIPGNYRLLYH